MDNSVSSIELLARLFNHSLRKRGFTRTIHKAMNPSECSGIIHLDVGVVGLVVAGELTLEFYEASQSLGIGEEFTLPANNYFQVTAGDDGAHLLLAKKRTPLARTTESLESDAVMS
jgi:hypothetical protein